MNIFWSVTIALLAAILLLMPTSVESASAAARSRERRVAVISNPMRTLYKIQMSIIVPVVQLVNQTFTFLWFDFQQWLPVPTAANLNTLYTSFGRASEKGLDIVDEPFVEEQKANMERRYLYQYIEGFFNSFGTNGTACVLRAICEMAEAPLHSNGLLGQVVETVMTPSLMKMPKHLEPHFGANRTRRDVIDDATHADLDYISAPVEDEYTEAYLHGKEGDCYRNYRGCPVNIFKMFDI